MNCLYRYVEFLNQYKKSSILKSLIRRYDKYNFKRLTIDEIIMNYHSLYEFMEDFRMMYILLDQQFNLSNNIKYKKYVRIYMEYSIVDSESVYLKSYTTYYTVHFNLYGLIVDWNDIDKEVNINNSGRINSINDESHDQLLEEFGNIVIQLFDSILDDYYLTTVKEINYNNRDITMTYISDLNISIDYENKPDQFYIEKAFPMMHHSTKTIPITTTIIVPITGYISKLPIRNYKYTFNLAIQYRNYNYVPLNNIVLDPYIEQFVYDCKESLIEAISSSINNIISLEYYPKHIYK